MFCVLFPSELWFSAESGEMPLGLELINHHFSPVVNIVKIAVYIQIRDREVRHTVGPLWLGRGR
jgi:hypothetical protein